MERKALDALAEWKTRKNRKPLVLRGARQVGKTWLMKRFARDCFENSLYITFDENPRAEAVFTPDLNPVRIIKELELLFDRKIVPGKTLIIFDEIQESQKALKSLKYFFEEAPEYHIVCAGSLLGVALHKGTSFPVGKVEFLDIFPLSFSEFLLALGQEKLASLLILEDLESLRLFHREYIELLKQYFIIGGMPEVVLRFAENSDYDETRKLQRDIIDMYDQDFSKHAPGVQIPKIRSLWNSIPRQLAKENHKFIYNEVESGARAREYETALLWILDTGIAHSIHRVTEIKHPLKAYLDPKAFKLFMGDIGLLCCMSGLEREVVFNGNDIFVEFKGALAEQYVMQEYIAAAAGELFYWMNDKTKTEVDFVFQAGENIVPLEVKSGINLRAKSLTAYIERFSPAISIRTSLADYKVNMFKTGKLVDLPLYAVCLIDKVARKYL
jgi:predicted AAA+ superfamily ATPase